LLIKALDFPGEEMALIECMVGSDGAAVMIDPVAASQAARHLRSRLSLRLEDLAAGYGESHVVRVMRDHLIGQIQIWATRAVDDVDSRRRAERFLAWADRPGQLEAAQRRGLFVGMDAGEFRRLGERHVQEPVTPETALAVWVEVDKWLSLVQDRVGDAVVASWETAARDA
jgi:hypothetical protein